MDRFVAGPRLLHVGCNLACGVSFLYLAVSIAELPAGTSTPFDAAVAVSYSLFALALFFRPAARVARYDWKAVALCGGSCLYYLMFDLGARFDFRKAPVGEIVITVGVVGWIVTAAFLGRSFSILPARRSLRTSGPYRLIRHPLYASYLVVDVGILLCFPSAWNSLVVLVALLLYMARVSLEEQVLAGEPHYPEYIRRTRFRLIPFVW